MNKDSREKLLKAIREELKKCLSQSGDYAIVDCCMCGEDFVFYPTMCCSGTDCGCMGKPTSPQVCSDKCYNDMIDKTRSH